MGRGKILVVDDEENFLRLLKQILEKEGYEVRTAADGQEALQWIERETFDLALIDIRMNPVDGLVLLGTIKDEHPQLKVIMMTAYPSPPSPATRRLSLERGSSGYLVKPIEVQELKETIRAILSEFDKGTTGRMG
jgi:DNA-binding response OmpR family regulator